MTREETKECRIVMQHFEDGGEIEVIDRFYKDDIWQKTSKPTWNWAQEIYRIKLSSIKMTEEERLHILEQQPIPILDKKLGKTYFLPRYLINTLDVSKYYILNPATMEWEDWGEDNTERLRYHYNGGQP